MKKVNLPLDIETIKSLHAGDKVLLTGKIITGRDAAHKRLVDLINENKSLPINIENETIYYVGPCPEKKGIAVNSCGPTTSSRMDLLSPTLLKHGLIGMIGKGARSKDVIDAMIKYNGIYFAAIGGAGALYAKSVKKSSVLAFDDLGTEAIHEFIVEDFPVIVATDSYGESIY